MAKFVSQNNTVSTRALKRRAQGSVVVRHHGGWEDVKFTRCAGGWLRERVDVTSERPVVVNSADVARECNRVVGCKDSWARIY